MLQQSITIYIFVCLSGNHQRENNDFVAEWCEFVLKVAGLCQKIFCKRIKLLYILAYLWENTDEEHSVTNTDVRTYLEQIHEISVDRRTIVSDMQLLNIFGRIADFEIEYDSSAKGYKIIQRSFEREDIQLLIDSLVNSKFIPEKKLKHLLEKLKNLISSHSWELLTIPIHYSDLQNKNKHLLYTLDSIREAIKRNKKISFYYCKNNLTSNTESTNTPYTVSPYWLRPNPDRYYLLATIDCDDGIPIWDFEVAKMSDIQILNQERTQEELVQHLNLKRQVKLRFLKEYKNKIIDTFGEENIMLIPNGDYFTASISISGESDFYDWILDQGDTVEVIGPAEIINDVKLSLRFLYKGIIIKHNKTEPTYTKTSLFLCEKRRFFMARTEKGGEVF